MDRNPVVLVMSCCGTKPIEAVKNIIESNGGECTKKDTYIGKNNFSVYLCDIKTKYYQNTLTVLPFDGEVDAVPADVLKMTEGFIMFFDAKNDDLLKNIPKMSSIIESNNIGLAILLTHKLHDNPTLGLTYKQIKGACPVLFDVIELCSDEEESAITDHAEYNEVIETLHNYVWSNVNCPNVNASGRNTSNSDMDSNSMEDELEAFENLLTNIQNFKKVSSSLEREQALDQAEKIAKIFANIINED